MNGGYPYAHGYLLEKPNTYAYSDFRGEAFLESWIKHRRGAFEQLPAPESAPTWVTPEAAAVGNCHSTSRILESTLKACSDDAVEDIPAEMSSIIQRFEVTKRIHRTY